ncbi:MAG: tRNA (adenosine(37)-N6)-threonylcarbamoyltransferase complex ATPase subunit type 1 TsaE [Pseudohongiellaceae bacterium]
MAGNHSSSTEFLADESATEEFGRRLALAAQSDSGNFGTLIYLQGDLGAGKTTLVRGFMRGYGYQGPVKSPTYTLVEPYELPGCNIYHFDLYRISDPEEIEFMGVAEYFSESNLCLIEWPERGKGVIPSADLEIGLSGTGDGRSLRWRAVSLRGEQLAERLLQAGRNP